MENPQQADPAALRRQLGYITDVELFALLRITTGTGRNRQVAGTLPPFYKVGREKLFKLAEVDA
jgi:hypothetical protein